MKERENTGAKSARRAFENKEGRGKRPQTGENDSFSRERRKEASDLEKDRIEGRNAVLELLRSGRDVDKLYVAKDAVGSIGKVTAEARKRGVPVSMVDRRKLDFMSVSGAHQGVIAQAAARNYATVEELLENARSRGEAPLLVVCDGITDPHNIGAIIRSAEIAGAHGVLISKHRSAGLNAACAKAAAGALEYMPVARVSNLASALRDLKERGIFLFGTGAEGAVSLYDADFTLPCALIIGSEGEGMSRLTAELCDFIVHIPMKGKIPSLNASAAAAVVLFESLRRRMGV